MDFYLTPIACIPIAPASFALPRRIFDSIRTHRVRLVFRGSRNTAPRDTPIGAKPIFIFYVLRYCICTYYARGVLLHSFSLRVGVYLYLAIVRYLYL